METKTSKKIEELQLLEQNIQALLLQKQTFQAQELDLEKAIKEVDDASGEVYKIVGNIMVKFEKEALRKDLKEDMETIQLRLRSIEKQEGPIREKVKNLQGEILKGLENGSNKKR